jgi:hypothetical protein
MVKRACLLALCSLLFLPAAPTEKVSAGPQTPTLLTQGIDESRLVTLWGNTRPEANAVNDRGPVVATFRMEHMMLQLRRPPAREQALEQLINQLHDRGSANFHHWLTAQEFGQRYGLAQEDLATIVGWLQSHGFQVNVVYPNRMLIDFSGTAGQVGAAFHTVIHHLNVNGKNHIANMSDPKIPAALAAAVAGVVSMHDFKPHPMNRPRANYTAGGGYYLVVPADLATIYNLNPLFAAGYSGQGQTIVVVEDTNVYSAGDWNTFRTKLGLATAYPYGTFTQVHPPGSGANNCINPGVNGDDAEAILDAEWASAGAPNAAIELASCADTATFGGFIALQNLLNASSTPPAVVSISYGDSEPDLGQTANAAIKSLYQQAVTEGVSVFVSSGDEGAASSDANQSYATHGVSVSGFTSTPYNVSVGGTDFGDTYAGTNGTYWSATNASDYGSALSYVPEIPWNDSCASVLIATYVSGSGVTYGSSGFCNTPSGSSFLTTASGSGGPSGCATGTPSISDVVSGSCAGYAKPSWQSVLGNPSDGVRDTPDVSLFAANGVWGHYYVVCWSDIGRGGSSCTGTPDTWSGFGGTSVSSPIMAAIQALINQATGTRAGNPNPSYYSLAASEFGASGNSSCNSTLGNGVASTCVFYDVTQGDMDVPCLGSFNCYLPSGTYGVLSTSNAAYQPAYGTKTGWDFATGIGTVNAYNLVAALAPPIVNLSPGSVGFAIQLLKTPSAAKSVTLSNTGLGSLTINSITIAGANSADFTLTHTCPLTPSTLAGGANCTLKATFKPTAAGPRKSSISISDNAGGTPQTLILTGVGTAASLSPTSLTFASQPVDTSSPAQTVTLTNTGSGTLNLWQIAIVGTNAGDFSKTTTCGSDLGGGANCTVSVTFKPTATGARTATLLFGDDGGGSPQAVSLAGTGM